MSVAKVGLCISSGLETRNLFESGWRSSAVLKCGSVVVTFAHGLSACTIHALAHLRLSTHCICYLRVKCNVLQ